MAANGFYSRLQLIQGVNYNPPPPSALTLQITSGNVTLMNYGASAVTVTDGTNPVTGCTLVISDGTKATANGQRVIGTAASGTYTVKATKGGYNDSGTVTFTCSAAPFLLNLLSTVGTNTTTNGANVTSWVDQGSGAQTWAEATLPPTYLSVGITGGPAVLFNGTTQLISSPSTSAYNLTATDNTFEWVVLRTTTNGGVSNRTITTHYDSAAFRGTQFLAQTTDVPRLSYGTGGQQVNIDDPSASIKMAAAISLAGDLYAAASGGTPQTLYVNGVSVATNTTLNWRDNNAAVVYRAGINFGATGNWTPMELYWRGKASRALTATEHSQLFLAMDIVRGL